MMICQTFSPNPTPTLYLQDSPSLSLVHFSHLATKEILQVIMSCNPTTYPLDPITMLQIVSQDLVLFITTIVHGSITSAHVPTAFKRARVTPILKKPTLDPRVMHHQSGKGREYFYHILLECYARCACSRQFVLLLNIIVQSA